VVSEMRLSGIMHEMAYLLDGLGEVGSHRGEILEIASKTLLERGILNNAPSVAESLDFLSTGVDSSLKCSMPTQKRISRAYCSKESWRSGSCTEP
jgi:hypothetical protein